MLYIHTIKQKQVNILHGASLIEDEWNLLSKKYVSKYIFDAYVVTKFVIEKEKKIEFSYFMIKLLTYLA